MRILFFLLFLSNVAWAVPVITGVSQTNDTITITGTGFGSHADYDAGTSRLNYKWDDFDDGTLTDVYTNTNGQGYATTFYISSSNNRPGSTYTVRWDRTKTLSTGIGVSTNSDAAIGYYTTAWILRPSGTTFPDVANQSEQHKIVRIGVSGDESGNNTYPNFTWGKHEGGTGSNHIYTTERNPLTAQTIYASNSTFWNDGQWHRIEAYITRSSGVGQQNGKIWYYLDGNAIINGADVYTDNGTNNTVHGWWGVSSQIIGASQDIYHDDVYFDQTPARVELGQGSSTVFGNRGKSEIQLPTAWSSTSITVSKNAGAFSNGTSVKVFVVDSNNDASNAYPITLGSTTPSDQTPPTLVSISPADNTVSIDAD